MKLCPQCEFLYEDDQIFCDMDGEGLVYDSRAEAFSDVAPAITSAKRQSQRSGFLIRALLGGLVVSIGLSFAYYASTRSVHIDPVSQSGRPQPNWSRQIAAASIDNSPAQPAASPLPSQPDAVPESASLIGDEASNSSASQSSPRSVSKGRERTSATSDSRLMISKRVAPLPQLNPLPQLPPPQRLPPAKPTTLATTTDGQPQLSHQTTTDTSQKTLIVEVKPESKNEKKQSKLGAFFKKTGVLTKPFKR